MCSSTDLPGPTGALSGDRPPRPSDSGSAVVEFALLVPVYALAVMGLLYLGGLSISRIDTLRAAIYLSSTPGVQADGDLPPGFFTAQGGRIFAGGTAVARISDEQTGSDIYDEHTMFEDLEEMARDPLAYYEFRNGQVVYVVEEDRLSPYGQYIYDNQIEDQSAAMASALNGWMARTTATGEYSFRVPFQGFDLKTVQSVQTGVVRAEKVRGNQGAAVMNDIFDAAMPGGDESVQPFAAPN